MPKPETHPVERAALATAKMLQHLDPGQMAELRRIQDGLDRGARLLAIGWHGIPETIGSTTRNRGWQSSVFWPF